MIASLPMYAKRTATLGRFSGITVFFVTTVPIGLIATVQGPQILKSRARCLCDSFNLLEHVGIVAFGCVDQIRIFNKILYELVWLKSIKSMQRILPCLQCRLDLML